LKFHFILPIIITLAIIGSPLVFAIYYPSIDNDLKMITVKIIDLQILLMDDTPGYYLDNADLVKITIKVTNDGLDYFLLNDKMVKLWVMEPDYRKSTPDNKAFDLVDNYFTIYDDELEVIYDNLQSGSFLKSVTILMKELELSNQKKSRYVIIFYEFGIMKF